MRYEERRDKVKLLFIELLMIRDLLQEMNAVNTDQYILVTPDSSSLQRLLVDSYSLIQQDEELIQMLVGLRTQLATCQAKQQFFLSQIALPMMNANPIVAEHSQWSRWISGKLLPQVNRALQILAKTDLLFRCLQ